jgi:hypothetical protein
MCILTRAKCSTCHADIEDVTDCNVGTRLATVFVNKKDFITVLYVTLHKPGCAMLALSVEAQPSTPPPVPYTMDERFAFERAWDRRYREGIKPEQVSEDWPL